MTVIDSTPVTSLPVDVCVAAGSDHPRPDGQDRYTIREVAAYTGLSAPTLRWYEEIGLRSAAACARRRATELVHRGEDT
ncbi:MerR family DNA-binding transcriptional regulator [Streptomyces sioyaensis]|uniref:MerR family DNA-binding transcriptional regulator n=1 Tax=Streptomyces sioyaensis TaxID=67364 RepID=UPI00378D3992